MTTPSPAQLWVIPSVGFETSRQRGLAAPIAQIVFLEDMGSTFMEWFLGSQKAARIPPQKG